MQTEVVAKIEGETVCLIKFGDFDKEPNHAWYIALSEAAAGRSTPPGTFGREGAAKWIALVKEQFPAATIKVIRR